MTKKYSYNGAIPAPLPKQIRHDGRLRTGLDKCSPELLAEMGFLPEPSLPAHDPEIERLIWDGGTWQVQLIPVPEPLPEPLSVLDFELHVQVSAGLSDAAIVAMLDDPDLKLVWHRLGRVSEVNRDHPLIQGGLDALVATNHLTAPQRADVVADWPAV